MTWSSMLPYNSTEWERAESDTSAERYPLPTHLIPDMWNPDLVPEHLLGHLARNLSVDVYYDDWPVERKREAAWLAFEHHRKKGTLWTILEYLRLNEITVDRVTVPPQGVYAVEGWSEGERESYLARLTQLRIHRSFPVDIRADGIYGDDSFLTDEDHFNLEPAWHGYRKRAYLVDPDGTETDLNIEWQTQVSASGEAVEIETIVLPLEPDAGFYGSEDYFSDFFDIERVRERIVQVETGGTYGYTYGRQMFGYVVPNGLKIAAEPELILENVIHASGIFSHADFFGDAYALQDSSRESVYEKYYIHDDTIVLDPIETGGSYFSDAWFGWPAYTAELQLSIPGSQLEWGADEYFDEGFFMPPELETYERVLDAVERGKALRDRVDLNLTTHRWPSTRDRLKIDGSWRIGEMIKDR